MNELRAPRLTENRLADLEVAVIDLQDSVEYLEDATKPDKPMNPELRKRLADKAAALARAKQWIEGKVAAERSRRD